MSKYVIRTRNKMYNGVTEGVLLQNGQAVVEDELIKNLLVVNTVTPLRLLRPTTSRKRPSKGWLKYGRNDN